MKSFLLTLLTGILLLFATPSQAMVSAKADQNHSKITAVTSTQIKPTKKLNFVQRLMVKRLAKKMKRQQKRASPGGGGMPNILGLLSLIFGAAAFFIPWIGILLAIAAVVLGVLGLKRDENRTMAIIGLVLGGIAVIVAGIFLLAVLSAI